MIQSVKNVLEQNKQQEVVNQVIGDKKKSEEALVFDAARFFWDGKMLKKYVLRSYLKMLRGLRLRKLRFLMRLRKLKLKMILKRMERARLQAEMNDNSNSKQKYSEPFSKKAIDYFKLSESLMALGNSGSLSFKLITMHYQRFLHLGIDKKDPQFYSALKDVLIFNLDDLLIKRKISVKEHRLCVSECEDFCVSLNANMHELAKRNEFFKNKSLSPRQSWMKYFEYLKSNSPALSHNIDSKNRLVMNESLQKQIRAKACEEKITEDYEKKSHHSYQKLALKPKASLAYEKTGPEIKPMPQQRLPNDARKSDTNRPWFSTSVQQNLILRFVFAKSNVHQGNGFFVKNIPSSYVSSSEFAAKDNIKSMYTGKMTPVQKNLDKDDSLGKTMALSNRMSGIGG